MTNEQRAREMSAMIRAVMPNNTDLEKYILYHLDDAKVQAYFDGMERAKRELQSKEQVPA